MKTNCGQSKDLRDYGNISSLEDGGKQAAGSERDTGIKRRVGGTRRDGQTRKEDQTRGVITIGAQPTATTDVKDRNVEKIGGNAAARTTVAEEQGKVEAEAGKQGCGTLQWQR